MRKAIHTTVYLLLVWIGTSACTPTAGGYGAIGSKPVSTQARNTDLLRHVATARIGSPRTFIDPATGLTSKVTVHSEYFSANGRSCRRFSQHLSNSATSLRKLGCHDKRLGWLEIPVSHIVDQ